MKNTRMLLAAVASLVLAQAPVGAAWPTFLTLSDRQRTVRNHVATHLAIFAVIQAAQIGLNAYNGAEHRGVDTRTVVEKLREAASMLATKDAWKEHFANVKMILKREPTRDPLAASAVAGYTLWKALTTLHVSGSGIFYGVKKFVSIKNARQAAASEGAADEAAAEDEEEDDEDAAAPADDAAVAADKKAEATRQAAEASEGAADEAAAEDEEEDDEDAVAAPAAPAAQVAAVVAGSGAAAAPAAPAAQVAAVVAGSGAAAAEVARQDLGAIIVYQGSVVRDFADPAVLRDEELEQANLMAAQIRERAWQRKEAADAESRASAERRVNEQRQQEEAARNQRKARAEVLSRRFAPGQPVSSAASAVEWHLGIEPWDSTQRASESTDFSDFPDVSFDQSEASAADFEAEGDVEPMASTVAAAPAPAEVVRPTGVSPALLSRAQQSANATGRLVTIDAENGRFVNLKLRLYRVLDNSTDEYATQIDHRYTHGDYIQRGQDLFMVAADGDGTLGVQKIEDPATRSRFILPNTPFNQETCEAEFDALVASESQPEQGTGRGRRRMHVGVGGAPTAVRVAESVLDSPVTVPQLSAKEARRAQLAQRRSAWAKPLNLGNKP